MNKISFLIRNCIRKHENVICNGVKFFSTNNNNSDNEESNKKVNQKNNEALNKLNDLLQQIITDTTTIDITKETTLNLAKPKTKNKIEKSDGHVSDNIKSEEQQMVNAVKEVVKILDGEPKENESELLRKLLSPVDKNEKLIPINEVFKGMKIELDSKSPDDLLRKQLQSVVKNIKQKNQYGNANEPVLKKSSLNRYQKYGLQSEKIDLFTKENLNIFNLSNISEKTEGIKNEMWDKCFEKELKMIVNHPPANYFQQMILWTEQGKIWRFPIDNEQDLPNEENVYFTEHIFLEKYLESWCPTKGPIRHFMELVCVGLSKNPYLTVEKKKEHIFWFKNYFNEKRTLLEETGALKDDNLSMATTKSLE